MIGHDHLSKQFKNGDVHDVDAEAQVRYPDDPGGFCFPFPAEIGEQYKHTESREELQDPVAGIHVGADRGNRRKEQLRTYDADDTGKRSHDVQEYFLRSSGFIIHDQPAEKQIDDIALDREKHEVIEKSRNGYIRLQCKNIGGRSDVLHDKAGKNDPDHIVPVFPLYEQPQDRNDQIQSDQHIQIPQMRETGALQ